jgi:hypothetical protein
MFNNFSIVSRNIMKPIWRTRTHRGLSNNIKSVTRGTMVWEISTWQTKQAKTKQTNKQTNILHRYRSLRLFFFHGQLCTIDSKLFSYSFWFHGWICSILCNFIFVKIWILDYLSLTKSFHWKQKGFISIEEASWMNLCICDL